MIVIKFKHKIKDELSNFVGNDEMLPRWCQPSSKTPNRHLIGSSSPRKPREARKVQAGDHFHRVAGTEDFASCLKPGNGDSF